MRDRIDVALITLLDGDLALLPEHLGVAYLASELRKAGWSAEIFPTSPANEADVIRRISSLKPKVAGFSLTTASFARAARMGEQLREALGQTLHITAGGPLVSYMGASLLRNPAWSFLDSAVRGEGEIPIVELLQAISGRKETASVANLCYRRGSEVYCNPVRRPVQDLDSLGTPSRDLGWSGPFGTARIASSRGCTSRCSFCNAPNARNTIEGKVWRGRSPENVVDEIEELYRDREVRDFEFVDSTFEDPGGTQRAKQRVANIARLILERDLNITFGCCVQAQNWRQEDLWLIQLLKRAGLERVLIGVESGSSETLQRWSKKATAADNRRAVELFQANDVYVTMGFIMFHPHSTRTEVMNNAAFLQSLGCHHLRPFCTRMEVYPGTETLETLRREGLLGPDYGETLNPYAYEFLDPEMGRLAYTMALLAGEEYANFGTVDVLPPHLQFGFLDAAIHRNLCWEMRNRAQPQPRIQSFCAWYRRLCRQIADYNFNLFQTISSRIFAGAKPEDVKAETAEGLSRWYSERISWISARYSDCLQEEAPLLPSLVSLPELNQGVGAL